MKRIFVLCDGTWQSELNNTPTNVAQFMKLLGRQGPDGTEQIVIYNKGVGANVNLSERISGGAFGEGLEEIIEAAYVNLASNYQTGDEVYLVGFSRGAYTVRSLAGLIRACGLLPPKNLVDQAKKAYKLYRDKTSAVDNPSQQNFRRENESVQIPIKALCCFDTVGAMGIPAIFPFTFISKFMPFKHAFHDTQLNRLIENAFHAIAIDEHRKLFMVTPMDPSPNNTDQRVVQAWFPGDHTCVGGGADVKMANSALLWMISELKKLGVAFDNDIIRQLKTDPMAEYQDSASGLWNPFTYLPKALRPVARISHAIHRSGAFRLLGSNDYHPRNISPEIQTDILMANNNAPSDLQVLDIP